MNGDIIGVDNVSTTAAKRLKLPENTKTDTDKSAEVIRNVEDVFTSIEHNAFDFDDCSISEVIMSLQKLARSPNPSAINMAFTKHITNSLMQVREKQLKHEAHH